MGKELTERVITYPMNGLPKKWNWEPSLSWKLNIETKEWYTCEVNFQGLSSIALVLELEFQHIVDYLFGFDFPI